MVLSNKIKDPKKNQILFITLSIIMFLFAALRGSGDGDYYTYKEYSEYIVTIQDVFNSSFPMEIGFRSISYFVNTFSMDSQWVIIIMNILSTGVIFLFIFKKSKNPFLSLIIFFPWFLTMDMHSARTAIAAAFGIWSIYFFYKNDLKKSFLFISIGILFHKTVIVLLALPLLKRVQLEKVFWIAVGSYVASIFVDFQILIGNSLNFIGLSTYADKIFYYLESSQFGYEMSILDPRIILMLIILSLGYILKDKLSEEQIIMYKTISFGFICMSLFRHNTLLAIRLSYYFYIISIVFIPNMINNFDDNFMFGKVKYNWNTISTIIYTIYAIGIIIKFTSDYLIYMW